MSWVTVTGGTPITQGQFFSVEITFQTVPGFGPDLPSLQGALDGMGDAIPGTTTLQQTASMLTAGTGYYDLIYSGQVQDNGGLTAGQFIADVLSILNIVSANASVGSFSSLNAGPLQISNTGGSTTPTAGSISSLLGGTPTATGGPSIQTAVIFAAIAIVALVAFGFSKEIGL